MFASWGVRLPFPASGKCAMSAENPEDMVIVQTIVLHIMLTILAYILHHEEPP